MTKKILYPLGVILSFGLLSSCYAGNQPHASVVIPIESQQHTTVVTQYRTPPHAPEHGYRQRYNDHDLRFDSSFGAYLVIGSPGIYFYGDNYLRFHENGWQISGRINGGWRAAQPRHIPRRLREHHAQRLRGNGHNNAPRHGYRRHYQGHDMTYDSGIGAYSIAKRPGIYFYNNRYVRRHGAVWQTANKLNGNWQTAKDRHVPKNLRKKKHRKKERKIREKRNKNRSH